MFFINSGLQSGPQVQRMKRTIYHCQSALPLKEKKKEKKRALGLLGARIEQGVQELCKRCAKKKNEEGDVRCSSELIEPEWSVNRALIRVFSTLKAP